MSRFTKALKSDLIDLVDEGDDIDDLNENKESLEIDINGDVINESDEEVDEEDDYLTDYYESYEEDYLDPEWDKDDSNYFVNSKCCFGFAIASLFLAIICFALVWIAFGYVKGDKDEETEEADLDYLLLFLPLLFFLPFIFMCGIGMFYHFRKYRFFRRADNVSQ
eukprot:TRINITY_DN816_c0_g1_i1.p1 TRINITY_DN816_c0_g1~~TRINITY_DN816_c0_g1_i1.p1  ORF type:complete len:165 (+),score=56.90 TRINITY_DN816_c0_g1_i1:116-610(+)